MKIEGSDTPPDELSWAHPIVRNWFVSRFGSATEPQVQGWPHIIAGRDTLISAPTGSGKTLSAFLACIDQLVRKAIDGKLRDQTDVIYVSPLKALSNDIQENLKGPLGEISKLAQEQGIEMQEIRAVVRTGDTLASERQAMLKRPPHILVTTPESLYILLTAEKSRANLKHIKTIIVDEVHAVIDDKRGAHLALSLERLSQLTIVRPVRIGLSATQKPIELVADFLSGSKRSKPKIINVGHRRKLDLGIEIPTIPLGPIATNDMWDEIYDKLAQYTQEHRSVLVFVNTRKLVERTAMHLAERLGTEVVGAHHGSLSRKLRHEAEKKLKTGQIKILVATASLELGIDIGDIDLVCQVSSPRSIAVALQRIGRAGHWRGAIPKGRLFATTRDELIECAALVQAILEGDLDKLEMPEAPLDILAQQIVACCAAEEWDETSLYNLIKGAYPYRNLAKQDYEDILEMLSEGIAAKRARYGSYILRDRVNARLKGKRGARLAAITSGGAIPDTGQYTAVAIPDETVVGTLDEDFAIESNKGDIILLGNTSWRIHRVESGGRVLVEDAHGAPPTVPFWLGEAPGRTMELSQYVSNLRTTISNMIPSCDPENISQTNKDIANTVSWLKEKCGLDDSGAEQAIQYIVQSRAILNTIPSQSIIVAERFFDESGGMQLIIHSPFGARINKAWGLALRKRFCKSFDFELQAAATDNGLNIALSDRHSFPLADVFNFLHPNTLKEVLEQAVLASPLFNSRFRWDATRALALLRFMGGKKVPPLLQRLRTEDLLSAVFPQAVACQDNIQGDIEIPDHPLVREVMKDVLTEAMDIEGLLAILNGISSGNIECIAIDTPVPSQLSHEILNANPYAYLDDAPLEERRARAVQMRQILPPSVVKEVGLLDPSAIAQVKNEAIPDLRDADELHDFLQTAVALPNFNTFPLPDWPINQWLLYFDKLVNTNRATIATSDHYRFLVVSERVKQLRSIFPDLKLEKPIQEFSKDEPREKCLMQMIRGWLNFLGPVTARQIAELLNLSLTDTEYTLLQLEQEGSILRGNFSPQTITNKQSQKTDTKTSIESSTDADTTEWCERRLLARIHKLTIGELRRQIEPVTAAQFVRWLAHWQRVAPGTQLSGERGTLEILRQLQGFEAPANAWEKLILNRRIKNYDADILDRLCLMGQVGWGRLSPHPATLATIEEGADGKPTRRVIPSSNAPITFFVRDDMDWMVPVQSHDTGLGHSARLVKEFLKKRGASFFPDIVRGTNLLKSEVETALWELVAAGIVTADGFDNLRALIDPKRRSGQGRGRYTRPRNSAGRWALLHTGDQAEKPVLVKATCKLLLERYGVVFRELLARESLSLPWRDLLMGFRLMEDRGEIRGGRFVSGFIGEQYALPQAVESLRATRNKAQDGQIIDLASCDPLNLVGIILPGDRISAASNKLVYLRDGTADV